MMFKKNNLQGWPCVYSRSVLLPTAIGSPTNNACVERWHIRESKQKEHFNHLQAATLPHSPPPPQQQAVHHCLPRTHPYPPPGTQRTPRWSPYYICSAADKHKSKSTHPDVLLHPILQGGQLEQGVALRVAQQRNLNLHKLYHSVVLLLTFTWLRRIG